MKKLGLIGCGMVANYGHLPAIQETAGIELVSVFDVSAERAEAARETSGATGAFTDMEAFLQSGLDAVVITSPAPVHYENVLACAEAGLPVLCEKPLATDDAEAEKMIEAMRAAGQLLVTGFDYRFSPVSLKIRDLIRDGALGEVRAARLVYLWGVHGKWEAPGEPDSGINMRRHLRMLEGGPMVDCGVHQIDLARWWFGGEVEEWTALGAWADEYEAPDHMWLHMEQRPAGQRARVHTVVEMSYSYGHIARNLPSQFLYEIIGTDGLIRMDRNARVFELLDSNGTHPLEWAWEKNFVGMYQAFARALETGDTGDLPNGEDGRIATRIAREATEAVQNSRRR